MFPILRLHDRFLAAVAAPRSPAERRAAERGLRRIASQVARTARRHGGRPPAALAQSGVAGTILEANFSLDLARWLARRYPRQVALVWRRGSLGEAADDLLSALVEPVEADGFHEPSLDVPAWLALAAGRQPAPAWLLDRLHRAAAGSALSDRAVDSLELTLSWKLGRASRTWTRFPPRPLFCHRGRPLRAVDLPALLRAPLPRGSRVARPAAERLIATARDTLAARGRETDPVTWASPRDVSLHRLDRGVDVALFGLAPERRLPLDSYIGFVAARNRVPVAYGGGWMFLGRTEIGVNLFEEFRGGESAYLFAQVLRVYRQRFATAQFLVDPFQFGAGNDEAIRSGAFWFYHRLGFRPTHPSLRALAEREAARIADRPGYRSPPSTLRRLAGGPLFLDGDGSPPAGRWRPVAPEVARLGLAVTRWIGARFGGDRDQARRFALRRVSRLLEAEGRDGWPDMERAWFERLALLVAMIPDLHRWPRQERMALRAALRAKGGPQESRVPGLLRRVPRLRTAMEALQSGGRRGG